jgi:hypothetical protein
MDYIWHRHEWGIGVLVMGLLLYLRFVHYTKGSWLAVSEDYNYEDTFVYYDDPVDITHSLYSFHCGIDLEILCANQGESYRMQNECEALYGPSFHRAREVHWRQWLSIRWHTGLPNLFHNHTYKVR